MEVQTSELEMLMKAALGGEQKAYAQLLAASTQMLRPYLAKRLRRPSDVEDVLQEILLSIHKARHTYDGVRPYRPWMFAIARFRLTDFLRAHYSDQLAHAAELEVAENVAATVTESPFNYESIKAEIDRLPGKQPKILQLLHKEGHTAREVAAQMQMSETAVKVAAHRAYKTLRKKLADER